jgi:two-component system LytT family sensor kinase
MNGKFTPKSAKGLPLIPIKCSYNTKKVFLFREMQLIKKISNYWLCQLAGWGILAISLLFFAMSFGQGITSEYLLKILIIMTGGILSTHILRWFIQKNSWLLLPFERVIVRLCLAVIMTSVLYSLFIMGMNELAGVEKNSRDLDFLTRLIANIVTNGIFIIPWVLFYYFYHYVVKSRRQEMDTLKLEALVKELELKTIKSHINPHFIFNALNSIRALIDENPIKARNAVTHLSNILRSSMQAEKLETVPLERELNIVKDYLELEYIRFEERLKIEYDINTDTLNQPVPPMMLQTLVENAIKHGISREMSGGVVKVMSFFQNGHHELVVKNSGHLNGHTESDGFGLSSTRNRLYLLFGDKARFSISQDGELVVAKVQIPKS